MSVPVLDNFSYGGRKPNFERDEFATIALMAAYPESKLPTTFIATVDEDGEIYVYNKNNTVDPVTGKWRLYSGATTQVESLPEAKAAFKDKIFQYVGETGTYTKGYFYECQQTSEDPVTYAWVVSNTQPGGSSIFYGTKSEWDALPLSEKQNYDYTAFDEPSPHNKSYTSLVYNSIYSALGRTLNCPPGYIRSGKPLNKIVVLGNSLTGIEYTYTRQNGEEFTEQRELGCCHSENQWICQTYKYLRQHINPDVKIYSAQCADWERDEHGNRQLSTILDKNIFVASDTVKTPTGGVVEDYLTADTDIVIIDLYENIPAFEDTPDNRTAMKNDFIRLYNQIHERCPNATIYQFGGFMHKSLINRCLNAILHLGNSTLIEGGIPQMIFSIAYMKLGDQRPTNSGFPHDQLLCVEGDTVYDVDGNPWTEIQPNWTSHPGDLGYTNLAVLVLFNLFNMQCRTNVQNFVPTYDCTPEAPVHYSPNLSCSIPEAGVWNGTGYQSIDDYNAMFNYAQLPIGCWSCAAFYFKSTGQQASFAEISVYPLTGGACVEKITMLSNDQGGLYYSRANTGDLFNTCTLKSLIDDRNSSRYSTYSSAQIDALLAGNVTVIAKATGTTDATFSDADLGQYREVVLLLNNANNTALAFKSIPGVVFAQSGGIYTSLKTFTAVLEGAASGYTATLTLDDVNSGTLHNISSSCISMLLGLK